MFVDIVLVQGQNIKQARSCVRIRGALKKTEGRSMNTNAFYESASLVQTRTEVLFADMDPQVH